MATPLDRLRAAHRYSSGSARREFARQIVEVEECERKIAESTTEPTQIFHDPIQVRWCAWCGETLAPSIAGDYCNESCKAEDAQGSPQTSESPAPSNGASNPEPLTSAPAAAPAAPAQRSDHVKTGQDWWAQEDRLAQLHDLWEVEGLTASACAAKLGCTKNAVIGQVQRREDLHQRREPAIRQSSSPPAAFLALGPAECCWPHGDFGTPDFHFCGAAAIDGKPYCQSHHERAYLKGSAARQWTEERREKMSALLSQRGAMPMRGGGGKH